MLLKVGACIAIAGLGLVPLPLHADDTPSLPRTTYGEIGLLEMPSARMAPDGELSLTISAIDGAQRYNAGFQILPWLEGSFRYSHVIKLFGSKGNYYDRSFGMKIRLMDETQYRPDLSLGFRDLLGTGIYSGEYLVASKHFGDFDTTLGIGWGRFAESNALPNPFGLLFSSFKTRQETNTLTGTVNFGQFFHGPKIGVFGGFIWHSPIEGLDAIAEYSSDRYTLERSFGAFRVRSPINLGLAYHVDDSIVFSAGWLYGTSYGATLSFSFDPTVSMVPIRLQTPLPQPYIRSDTQQSLALASLIAKHPRPDAPHPLPGPWIDITDSGAADAGLMSALLTESQGVRGAEKIGRTLIIEAPLDASAKSQCEGYARVAASFAGSFDTLAVSDPADASGRVVLCGIKHAASADSAGASVTTDPAQLSATRTRILADIAAQSIRIEAMSIEDGSIWLYYDNQSYRSESEAAGRLARILMADAPDSVELFNLISVKNGEPMREISIARSALERAAVSDSTGIELRDAVHVQAPPLDDPILAEGEEDSYPRLHWAIGPGLHQGLFDPNRALQIQVLGAADARLQINPQWTVQGRIEANIWNNFDLSRLSDSVLPHVRSDAVEYYKHGSNGIADLHVEYRTRLARDVFVEAKAGYLESMFAGGGGQLLWRKDDSRFAIGADLYEVWQRNFDRLFGIQSYHVMTGHVTMYYASPWYGMNFNLHVGRYLAGDYGATFEITRRFDTGIEVGAFATFTNVPFSKFGEGSFDKGIVIHIPFEWALPFYTQSSYDLTLRSLTRDGGQRLDQDDSLYEETQSTSYGDIKQDIDNVVLP